MRDYFTAPPRRSHHGGFTPRSIAERFWAKVDTTGECWIWTGSRNDAGYGQIYDGFGKLLRATRVSWEMEHGEELPESVFVCHKCDNPPCVRPTHLFIGGQLENLADMRRKGRQGHKLTLPAVLSIREGLAQGRRQTAIAAEFGVSQAEVSDIARGRIWMPPIDVQPSA